MCLHARAPNAILDSTLLIYVRIFWRGDSKSEIMPILSLKHFDNRICSRFGQLAGVIHYIWISEPCIEVEVNNTTQPQNTPEFKF